MPLNEVNPLDVPGAISAVVILAQQALWKLSGFDVFDQCLS